MSRRHTDPVQDFKDASLILITGILFFLIFVAPRACSTLLSTTTVEASPAARRIVTRPFPATPAVVR